MNCSFKKSLDTWVSDFESAQGMASHLSQLGLSDESLPSSNVIRASCLILQAPEALQKIKKSLLSRERELVEHGVLRSNQKVNCLSGGEMMVLNHILDNLHVITERIDTMLERAREFTQPDSLLPGYPVIKIGTNRVKGHKFQLANFIIKLKDVDRLLVYNEEHGFPQALIFPPESVRVSMPILSGELKFYAENSLGAAAKSVRLNEVKYV